MALLIDSSVEILGNVNVNSLYIRFYYSVDPNGKHIHTIPYVYTSKQSYEENIEYKVENIKEIPNYMDFSYVRELDGSDPLYFIHEKYKEYLSVDKTRLTPVIIDSSLNLDYNEELDKYIDPNTGGFWDQNSGYVYDISTGQLITTEEIDIPKLTEIDNILFIDLP